ncbi:hypothetical protein NQD34_007185 [Periophthalmus magnuspinnatus]|nr:hypothetical protein NQD34_007185 [Periophthalmus magnuspinnatus]
MGEKNGLQKRQEEVEEVAEIMLNNLNKANERGENLYDVEEKAQNLKQSGKVFKKTTKILMEQKKREAENDSPCISKHKCVLVVIAVIVLIMLGLCIGLAIGRPWHRA